MPYALLKVAESWVHKYVPSIPAFTFDPDLQVLLDSRDRCFLYIFPVGKPLATSRRFSTWPTIGREGQGRAGKDFVKSEGQG